MRTVSEEVGGISLWAAVLSNAFPAFRAPQDDPASVADPLVDQTRRASGEGDGVVGYLPMAGGTKRQGRYATGERNTKTRLTDLQVRVMRMNHEILGMTRRQCADDVGCSIWTARDILTYRTRAST